MAKSATAGCPTGWWPHKAWKLLPTDTNFLAAVKILYAQIAAQFRGQLWKDGGPVIGIRWTTSLAASPDYLLALKKIAIDSGIDDAPFYIKTGWPAMRKPVPLGELLPLSRRVCGWLLGTQSSARERQ